MRIGRKKQKPEVRTRLPANERVRERQVFSYYNTGAKQRGTSPQVDTKTVNLAASNRLRLIPTIIAVLVILASILFSLTLSTKPSVSTLNDQASPYRPLEEYAAVADEVLAKSLGNRTKVTVQTTEVEKVLLERFPELRAAKLRLPVLGRRPSLILDIKPPALLLTTATNSFVLDDAGVVIGDVKLLPQEYRSGLLVVKDESGLKVEAGNQILPSDTVAFMYEVVRQLDAQQLKVAGLALPASANELEIKIEGLPYTVKADVAGDVRLQIGSFLAVKEDLADKGITPAEYIDVRVEEKVFYK